MNATHMKMFGAVLAMALTAPALAQTVEHSPSMPSHEHLAGQDADGEQSPHAVPTNQDHGVKDAGRAAHHAQDSRESSPHGHASMDMDAAMDERGVAAATHHGVGHAAHEHEHEHAHEHEQPGLREADAPAHSGHHQHATADGDRQMPANHHSDHAVHAEHVGPPASDGSTHSADPADQRPMGQRETAEAHHDRHPTASPVEAGETGQGSHHHGSHAGHEDHSRHTRGDQGHAGHSASADHSSALYPGFSAQTPTPSERAHVPPPPPTHELPPIGMREMIGMMGMDDAATHAMLLVDQLEWRDVPQGGRMFWDARLWYGGDYHKLVINTEGSRRGGDNEGSVEVLWDRVIARWWNMQAGVTHDFGQPRERSWLTAGIHGLSPYWFEVSAMLYLGEQGRTALKLSGEYEILFTQRLILQTHLEAAAYGKDDPANALGAGLARAGAGLRLRYEFRREFAPYVGVTRSWLFDETAQMARAQGTPRADWQWMAGVRLWF